MHLLLDLSYFLSDYNGNCIPSHPALVAIILHMVFSSHGGNLEEYLGDGTQLDVVFALAGTAICSVLMEYQTGTHHHLDFGSEMSGRFTAVFTIVRKTKNQNLVDGDCQSGPQKYP